MKKLLYIGLLTVLILSLIGCSSGPENEAAESNDEIDEEMIEVDEVETETISIIDYYPFEENLIMDYEGEGIEYAEQTRIVEFIEDNKIQIKIENPGTTFVKVLEYSNGELKEVFGEGEFYHIENMLHSIRNSDNIILKEPLEVGTSWTNQDGDIIEITNLDEEIETPYDKYQALEVTTKFANGASEKRYYAKHVGFVGSLYEDGDFKVKTLLKSRKIEEQVINVEAYYPTSDSVSTKYEEREISFSTNDHIENILENILKNPLSPGLLPSISEDTKINMINLDRNTWTLKVDFSEELLEDMNAGSSYEFEVLRSIVNTLGRFYDVEKVYLTINGDTYESGHISLNEGEYFEINLDGIEKIED